MPGNRELARMSRLDGRAELRPGDVHVSLIGSRSLLRPVVDRSTRILGTGELAQHRGEGPGSLQVRGRDVDLRPGRLSGVDELGELEIGCRFDRSRGSNR